LGQLARLCRKKWPNARKKAAQVFITKGIKKIWDWGIFETSVAQIVSKFGAEKVTTNTLGTS
jgi:hypothetical protein